MLIIATFNEDLNRLFSSNENSLFFFKFSCNKIGFLNHPKQKINKFAT